MVSASCSLCPSPAEPASEVLAAFGTQRASTATVTVSAASALLCGATAWLSLAPWAGVVTALLGLFGAVEMVRTRGLPLYTVEHDALVRHCGRWQRRYRWTDLQAPVRLQRLHFEWFVVVGPRRQRLLLPVTGLAADQREPLRTLLAATLGGRATRRPTDAAAAR